MMNNCIILGTGRSGTSMVAGCLAKAGYYMGDRLIPSREGNPKGFFEDAEINDINEQILAQVLPKRPRFLGRWLFQDRPLYGQRWLAQLPLHTPIPHNPYILERIEKLAQKQPFCFKDPRFSYTLNIWQPHLKNTVFICIFRDPVSTANSILKEIYHEPYMHHFNLNFEQILNVWKLMYQHILEIHSRSGVWLFLHYHQVLKGDGLEKIATFTGASVDDSFPDRTLNRSQVQQPLPKEIAQIYNQLCQRANSAQILSSSLSNINP